MSIPDSWCNPNEAQPTPPPESTIKLSSLCARGWRPLLITGLLRDILIRHFSNASNIEDDDLLKYIWTSDVRTGILIESVHKWKGDLVSKRPAILLKRNGYRSVRHTINDLSASNGEGQTYNIHWVGSHTVFCIHGTGAATEILATETQRELTQFSPIVREDLQLSQFAVTEVGEISEVEESTENYVVPITLGWIYQESWRLRPMALPLRRISFSMLVGSDKPVCTPIPYQTNYGQPYDKFVIGTRGPGP